MAVVKVTLSKPIPPLRRPGLRKNMQIFLPTPARKGGDPYSTALGGSPAFSMNPYGNPGLSGLGDIGGIGDLGDGSGIPFLDTTLNTLFGKLNEATTALKICMAASVIAAVCGGITLFQTRGR